MRRALLLALLLHLAMSTGVLAATPTPTPAAGPTAAPSAWWEPVGLRGLVVDGVRVDGEAVDATASGCTWRTADGGRTLKPAGPTYCATVVQPGLLPGSGCPPSPGAGAVRAAGVTWRLTHGRVLRDGNLDPGSPELGTTASLLAAPAAEPGALVAVATDGTVWRRSPAGAWDRALVLLPRGVTGGTPCVTAVAAFSRQALTRAVYLATDGYSVLLSSSAVIGTDWVRAGPGLPDGVLALAADDAHGALFAATRDGLWVHRLQSFPAPPVYAAPDLRSRQAGTAALAVAGWAAGWGVLVLGRRLPWRRPATG